MQARPWSSTDPKSYDQEKVSQYRVQKESVIHQTARQSRGITKTSFIRALYEVLINKDVISATEFDSLFKCLRNGQSSDCSLSTEAK